MSAAIRTRILTLAIALAGALAFRVAQLPLPWLLGPMFACLLTALLGVPMIGAPRASNLMRTVLGVAVGASITPALFGNLPSMLGSLALVPLFVAAIGAAGYPYFRRVAGFDKATSYYAAMPGGLQDMLIFGEEAGGDVRALSLVHATRVLVVVVALPVILSAVLGLDLTRAPGSPARELPVQEGLLMVAIALLGWWAAHRAGLFGASILGPLILATIASLTGVIHQRPPAEAILAAQFFIGYAVGVKYAGITMAEIRWVIAAALGYCGLLSAISAFFMAAALAMGVAPLTEVLLSFSPGGQAEMAVLAIVAGADIAFVVTHHIIRLVVVIVGAPLIMRFLG